MYILKEDFELTICPNQTQLNSISSFAQDYLNLKVKIYRHGHQAMYCVTKSESVM